MSRRTDRRADGSRPRIAVVGGGFGGLTFCKTFRGEADVLLFDRQNHHLFQPLLYQVAMSGLSAPEIAAPIRAILSRRKRVATVMAEVTAVDLDGRTLRAGGREWRWDWLVLAPGGVTTWYGREEWKEHAPGLKTLRDALRIRTGVLSAFEEAETATDEEERTRLTTIVVVGGGPTGVELAGAMAELAHRVFRHDFRHVDPARTRVVLVEAADRILGAFPADLSARATAQLRDLGVEVRLGTKVEAIDGAGVGLVGPTGTRERIASRNVLWAGGMIGPPLLRAVRPGLPLDGTGRARVGPDLSVPGNPRVFIIGDAARVRSGVEEAPPLAPAAIQMGRHVARLIAREVGSAGAPVGSARSFDGRPAFRYRNKGIMATIGRRRAVAVAGPLHLSGFPAWLTWLFVHLITLVGFRNRLSVLLQWTWEYVTWRRGARIIVDPPAPRGDFAPP